MSNSRVDSMVMFRPPSDTSQSIMVLDLCGSSGIANQDEVMALHLRRRVEQLANPILEANHISTMKNTGDGFLVTFLEAVDAARAATGILAALDERNHKSVNPPIRTRIALHYGKTYSVFDSGTLEVYGNDVNIVFRLECLQANAMIETLAAFPEADRILCTRQFQEEVARTSHKLRVKFIACGTAQLKGINQPIEVLWMKAHADDSRVQKQSGTA